MIGTRWSCSALAVTLVILWGPACGGGERSSTSQAPAKVVASGGTQSSSFAPKTISNGVDRDPDRRAGRRYDNDDTSVVYFGHEAGPAQRRPVGTAVEEYERAALSGNGATACSLTYSQFADAIAEDYGRPPGPPALRGNTCAVVLSKLFVQNHRQFVADLGKFRVVEVRIRGHEGIALLARAPASEPESYIRVQRERDTWKVSELFDHEIQ